MTHPSAPERSSILLVDDTEESLIALEAVLGPLGQRVVSVRSGEQALKAMLREEFAVVLLDVLMPGMDGFETAGNIKRLDQTKEVPLILLTGTDVDTDYAYRGYALGAADFLAKPVDPWVLRTKVNVFLELHRKNRQLAVQTEQLRRLLAEPPNAGTPHGEDGTGHPTQAVRESAERLAEIIRKLVQIEVLLREGERETPPGLAERIADLERMIRSLGTGGSG